jgi:hypothetical protein
MEVDPYASDPVMQLFHADNPISKGTWTNDDGGSGYQSKITAFIEFNGVYHLYIRAYAVGGSGMSDHLFYNSSIFASDIPFNNYAGLRCDHSETIELNYFTSHATSNGNTRMCIEDTYGSPGKIIAQNNYYAGSGDFNWYNHSRIKKAFSRNIRSTHVFSANSYDPVKYCDVYMNCRNSTYFQSWFPALKADDAIQSAPASTNYNCISW